VLHLTNGYSGVEAVRRARVEGDVVAWRDVLHEGPVPAVSPEELRALRAGFLSGMGWGSEDAIVGDFEQRDERLERALTDDEPIALWFEDDLYDVLQMVEILSRVDGPHRVRLIVVGVDRWQSLAHLSPGSLKRNLDHAVPVTLGHMAAANRLYGAFRAPRPNLMTQALASAAGLPGGRHAARRLLQQLPWATDALTRSERQLLQAVEDGARTRMDAFVAAQRAEKRPFLGDTTAWSYLDRMAPLVTAEPLHLTDRGRAVLEGRDRWDDRPPFDLGGARIGPWRWDPAAQVVTRAASGP
jgi:hypothetical protein